MIFVRNVYPGGPKQQTKKQSLISQFHILEIYVSDPYVILTLLLFIASKKLCLLHSSIY